MSDPFTGEERDWLNANPKGWGSTDGPRYEATCALLEARIAELEGERDAETQSCQNEINSMARRHKAAHDEAQAEVERLKLEVLDLEGIIESAAVALQDGATGDCNVCGEQGMKDCSACTAIMHLAPEPDECPLCGRTDSHVHHDV